MFANNGLIAAMEELENEAPVDEVEAAELAVTVADESAEIQKENDEASVTVAQVEDAVQAGDELESVADVAAGSLEDGGEGLTEEAAEMASIAIESIRNRLGFRASTRLVPATESFGNTNTRRQATILVIENIGETVKKIWLAIKNAALRLWEKIKLFVNGLFKSASGLIKVIDGLRARAQKLPNGLTPKEDKIKVGSVANAISVKGEASLATFKQIMDNTAKLQKAGGALGKKVSEVAVHVTTVASGINTNGQWTAQNFVNKLGDANSAIEQATKSIGVSEFKDDDIKALNKATEGKGDVEVTVYGPFAGRAGLVCTKTTKDLAGGKSVEYSLVLKSGVSKAAESVQALKQNELMEVLNISEALAKGLDELKKTASEAEKAMTAVQKAAGVVAGAAAKTAEIKENKEARDAMKAMQESATASMKTMSSLSLSVPATAYAAAKAGADYVSASIRNLGEKS